MIQEVTMSTMKISTPASLVIEAFRGCNYRCPHCNVPGMPSDTIGPMSEKVFRAILPLIATCTEIGYTNFGEPMLNPHVVHGSPLMYL